MRIVTKGFKLTLFICPMSAGPTIDLKTAKSFKLKMQRGFRRKTSFNSSFKMLKTEMFLEIL